MLLYYFYELMIVLTIFYIGTANSTPIASSKSGSKQTVNSTFGQPAACYASTDLMERAFTQNNVSVSYIF